MTKLRRVLGALVAVGIAGVCVILSAQAVTPPASEMGQLLAEIRGLRADLNQAMGSNVRAQLLVGRLQLQEQRMNSLSAQLADVRRSLAAADAQRGGLEEEIKRFEETLISGAVSFEQRKDVQGMVAHLKQELSRVAAQRDGLRAQDTDLLGQLESERGRWIFFNERLDDIERGLPQAPAAGR